MNKGYKEFGREQGLRGKNLNVYVSYMTARGKERKDFKYQYIHSSYAAEWARRFRNLDMAWLHSDGDGKRIFMKILGKKGFIEFQKKLHEHGYGNAIGNEY